MLISVWRYSHLTLALSSAVFLFILSLTGIVLAFEPIGQKLQNNPSANDFPEQNVAQTIALLTSRYSEVLSITVDANGFVLASVITDKGELKDFYIHLKTGEKTGEPKEKSELIEFATNLHRSLFLKSWGRFFVGLNSFLLFLIAFTGLVLIVKRQQHIKYFFNKIVKENFLQFGHIYLGRLALIPLLVITLTGVYLSLLRFEIIPSVSLSHKVNFQNTTTPPKLVRQVIPAFINTPLKEIRALEFPFSDDPTDYYTLSLHKKEILVNQYTGEVLSELKYPLVELATHWSLVLHTGTGSYIWSGILILACCCIFFFMYSGFKMTLKRRNAKIKNSFSKKESTHILLVGSETGSTYTFAKIVQQQLKKAGIKVYVAQLNDVEHYPKMNHLIVLTATYGLGAPPVNAKKFEQKLQNFHPTKAFTFSVLGFGSLAYPEFCKYAFEVDAWLQKTPNAIRLLNVCTVNNRSWESFKRWFNTWSKSTHVPISISAKSTLTSDKRRASFFEIAKKTRVDETFMLEIVPSKNTKFISGDLLAIYPKGDAHERLYSVGLLANKNLLISVKQHKRGICSTELSLLEPGDLFEGKWLKNKKFHFPKKANTVVLISSGTGIAPFLGMIANNHTKIEIHSYWGGKNKKALSLYKDTLEKHLAQKDVSSFTPAFSREADLPKAYVQSLVKQDGEHFAKILKNKGFVMICGSLAMQQGVTEVLHQICVKHTGKPFSFYQQKGQVKMDCY